MNIMNAQSHWSTEMVTSYSAPISHSLFTHFLPLRYLVKVISEGRVKTGLFRMQRSVGCRHAFKWLSLNNRLVTQSEISLNFG